MKGQICPFGGLVPDVHTDLTDQEMARVKAAAERAGMTVEDFVTHAASTELKRQYLLPRQPGLLLALPVRTREGA